MKFAELTPRLPVRKQTGFTLVELLVVVFVIGLLMALLLPAVNAARESSRQVACKNNLRQFGIGMLSRASRYGTLCSGAFDWKRDGAVTEVGWVADLVNVEIPVGEMLCPSNPIQISEAYHDLLNMDPGATDPCIHLAGTTGFTNPDGTTETNPCRQIMDGGLAAGSETRRSLVETEIYEKFYNTNYAASWYLVRTGVNLTSGGDLKANDAACGVGIKSLNSTHGPLKIAVLDSAAAPSNIIPLMGDGAASLSPLSQNMGEQRAGGLTTVSFTNGPLRKDNAQTPSGGGMPQDGPGGWWALWNRQVIQDYRGFAPLHQGTCNLLFADGSVNTLIDENGDGQLNNGFAAGSATGFADAEIEIPNPQIMSMYLLWAEPR